MLSIFETHFLLVPFLHADFSAFSFSMKASDICSYVSPFLACSNPIKGQLFQQPTVLTWQKCTARLFTTSPFTGLQAWCDGFAVGLNVCKHFCKGQVAENLDILTASLEILRSLSFYCDVQTSEAPHLHIKKWTHTAWGDNFLVNNNNFFSTHAGFVWRI